MRQRWFFPASCRAGSRHCLTHSLMKNKVFKRVALHWSWNHGLSRPQIPARYVGTSRSSFTHTRNLKHYKSIHAWVIRHMHFVLAVTMHFVRTFKTASPSSSRSNKMDGRSRSVTSPMELSHGIKAVSHRSLINIWLAKCCFWYHWQTVKKSSSKHTIVQWMKRRETL